MMMMMVMVNVLKYKRRLDQLYERTQIFVT